MTLGTVALIAGVLGIGILAWVLQRFLAARRGRRYGTLRSVDLASRPGPTLRSERWRLVGRPDELRERRDGSWIPVEVKSRHTPARGPLASHVAQIAAYCLLVEETSGLAPEFGVLEYSDGGEFQIPWNDRTREWLWSLRLEMDRPYDGRNNASPSRCRNCRWREGCDARVG
jgi:CRISPR-associated exonuclease Cas4